MDFIKGKFTEEEFENAIIEYFQGMDKYTYEQGENIHRKFEDVLIESDLKAYLVRQYPDLTEPEIVRTISRLDNVPSAPLYKGSREAFWLINEGFDLQRDDSSKIAQHIHFIDFETPSNNTFKVVNQYVKNAITCTGIENIVNADDPEDLFSEEFLEQLDKVKLPITKFNALLKLLRKAVSGYGKVNKAKGIIFTERLKKVIEMYNNRDKLVFTSEVVADFIDGLSDELIKILNII